MTHRGLIGAVLYAKDVARLAEFYSAVAHLDVESMQAGFAVLGRPPSQVVIVRIPQRLADEIDLSTPPLPREATPIKLVFAVDDIAGARRRAAERGGVIHAVDREWEFEDVRVCDGCDPEGNVFQIRHAA